MRAEPEAEDEPEEFVREKYVRDNNAARAWALSSLSLSPDFASSGGAFGTTDGMTGTAQGFFPASRFASHRAHIEKRGPLHWPDYVLLSSDHTSPRWRYESHHRLKNILVTLEWVPDAGALAPLTTLTVDGLPAASGAERSDGQAARAAPRLLPEHVAYPGRRRGAAEEEQERASARRAAHHPLRPWHAPRATPGRARVRRGAASLRATCAPPRPRATAPRRPAAAARPRRRRRCTSTSEASSAHAVAALRARRGGPLLGRALAARGREPAARCTRRRTLGVPMVAGGKVAAGLRAFGTLLDAAPSFQPPPRKQLQSAMQAYRFIDNQLSFSEADARLCYAPARRRCDDRRRWVVDTAACRRRAQSKIDLRRGTALATVLSVEDEYHLLVQSATVWRIGYELRRRQLGTHDVFHAFNGSRNGLLSCGELGAGLHWLGMRLEERELHDVVLGLDDDGDGLVSLDEWCGGLAGDLAESEPSTQEELAALSLRPMDVQELYEGARQPAGPADPIPAAAIARFKFKLVAQKALACVWSTRNTAARSELSFWAPDLDTTPLSRRSRARLCLGHACVDSVDAPGKVGRPLPLALDVIDSSVTLQLGASDYLASVVEQLLRPPPLQARLALDAAQAAPLRLAGHPPELVLCRARHDRDDERGAAAAQRHLVRAARLV